MRVLRNIGYVISAYVKLLLLKVLHPSKLSFGNIIRIAPSTRISISDNSKLHLGNNFKVGENSVLSVLRGGVLEVSNGVALSSDNRLVCHKHISIGDNTIFGPSVYIYDHDHVFNKETGVEKTQYIKDEVIIGKNCWIGANVIILRGTTIGDNCLVGAGCILKGDYPSGSKIIQKRETTIY